MTTNPQTLRERFEKFSEDSRKQAIAYGRLKSWEKRNKQLYDFIEKEKDISFQLGAEIVSKEERSRLREGVETILANRTCCFCHGQGLLNKTGTYAICCEECKGNEICKVNQLFVSLLSEPK